MIQSHSMKDQLLTKIHDHTAVVAVIGLGYVGLPLAVAFAEKGFPVVGIEVDGRKVAAVQRGESYVQDIPSERLATLTNDERRTMEGHQPPWHVGGAGVHDLSGHD